jgi:site-specific recombinase XerC
MSHRTYVGMDILGITSEVGKEAFTPFTISFPAPAPRFSPMQAYLSRLAPSSQLTMKKLLQRIVTLLGSSTAAEAFPWSRLDYATTIQLRKTLVSRYAPATANLALSALRGVLREAWRLGQISFEDFKRAGDLARVRGDRINPRKAVDTGKIEELLAVTRSDQSVRGRRDLAILSILYGVGLRRAELVHLDLSHMDGSRLMVLGKGRQWRTAHLGQDAAAALECWLSVRGTTPGALFLPVHRSGALRQRRLSTEAVARIVARRANAAGVGDLRPHDLRRALATRLLETGVDVLLVQRILGHRSVATTQIYDCRIDSASQTIILPKRQAEPLTSAVTASKSSDD